MRIYAMRAILSLIILAAWFFPWMEAAAPVGAPVKCHSSCINMSAKELEWVPAFVFYRLAKDAREVPANAILLALGAAISVGMTVWISVCAFRKRGHSGIPTLFVSAFNIFLCGLTVVLVETGGVAVRESAIMWTAAAASFALLFSLFAKKEQETKDENEKGEWRVECIPAIQTILSLALLGSWFLPWLRPLYAYSCYSACSPPPFEGVPFKQLLQTNVAYNIEFFEPALMGCAFAVIVLTCWVALRAWKRKGDSARASFAIALFNLSLCGATILLERKPLWEPLRAGAGFWMALVCSIALLLAAFIKRKEQEKKSDAEND